MKGFAASRRDFTASLFQGPCHQGVGDGSPSRSMAKPVADLWEDGQASRVHSALVAASEYQVQFVNLSPESR